MPKALINTFNGGMINDARTQSANSCMVSTNFDILAYPHKLVPIHASEDGDSAGSTSRKQAFCVALGSSSTWRFFGLGVVSGTGRAEVLYKNLTTGGSTDLDDNGWSTPSNNQSASGTTSFNLFVYYKTTGLIYGAKAGTHIWAFDPTGSAAFADTHQALTYTNIAQGLVHSKDDILYIPYDNKIATNNNGSWNTTALTGLPSSMYITSICEYGNYLAIAMAPLSGTGNSRVFLWDRDTSITTVSESIDAGPGTIKILEEVDGALIGILRVGGSSSTFKDRIVFKYLSGNKMVWFNEILTGSTTSQFPINKQKINGKLYFLLSATINGAVREGLFSIGRKSANSQFVIVHESTPNNDTALSSGTLNGFYVLDDYIFISYTSGGTYYLSKSDDQATYPTAIYESLINPGMSSADRENPKKLIGVACTWEPLTSGQTVTVKYRVDTANTGSWITVFTASTVGSTSFENGYNSTGGALTDGQNYEFRIESTGGAQITSLAYKYENMTGNVIV